MNEHRATALELRSSSVPSPHTSQSPLLLLLLLLLLELKRPGRYICEAASLADSEILVGTFVRSASSNYL